MNKKLLAVAVASALAAPVVAFAQSNVTLYGSADVAWASKADKRGNGSVLSKVSGIGEGWQAGNRIGFRGSEDLGGGMSAQFLIEQGINITRGQLFSSRAAAAGQQYDGIAGGSAGGSANGTMPTGAYSTATNRQSFVGLKAGWGELLGGYQYTTLYRISTLSGYFVGSEQPGGDIMHTVGNGAFFGGTRANGVVYNSPIFADGFQVSVLKGGATGPEAANFDAAQGDGKYQNNAKRWSVMPTYNKGPLSVAGGYTHFVAQSNANIAGATCFTNIWAVCTSAPAVAGTTSTDLRSHLWQLGVSYRMGALNFTGEYNNGKKADNGVAPLTGLRGTSANDIKIKGIEGGVEFTAGAWRPFLMLSRSTEDTTASGTAASVGRTGNYKEYQFGVRYDLSKRTLLYVMHGKSKDSSTTGDGAGLRSRDGTAAGLYVSF